mgnify:FL=1
MNKKIALVTGSAKRIGREIVIHLANNNYQPLIHYNQSANDAKNLKKLLFEHGITCLLYTSDAADE